MVRHRQPIAPDREPARAGTRRAGGRPTVATRTVELAMHWMPAPRRILDVGCGTGDLLRRLAAVSPTAVALVGVDAAPDAIEAARADAQDDRLRFEVGVPDRLHYADGTFDLVVSTASFDHWPDPQAVLAQCARVLAPGGLLVMTGRFSAVLTPGLLVARRAAGRGRRRAEALLARHGFRSVQWHPVHGGVRAVTATVRSRDWPLAGRSA